MIIRVIAWGQHWVSKALAGCVLLAKFGMASASDNPWGFATVSDPNSIETSTGKTMSTSFRWILSGVGFFLLVAAIVMIIGVMNKSAEEKRAEHVNPITVIVLALFCVIAGGVLVALAWKGTAYTGT